jgi:chromosome segregation ATPase
LLKVKRSIGDFRKFIETHTAGVHLWVAREKAVQHSLEVARKEGKEKTVKLESAIRWKEETAEELEKAEIEKETEMGEHLLTSIELLMLRLDGAKDRLRQLDGRLSDIRHEREVLERRIRSTGAERGHGSANQLVELGREEAEVARQKKHVDCEVQEMDSEKRLLAEQIEKVQRRLHSLLEAKVRMPTHL